MKSKSVRLMFVLTVVLGLSGLGSSQVAKANTISILSLDTSGFDTQILGALTGTTSTVVSPGAFATIDLTAYDVLYVGSTFQNGSVTIPSTAALNALNARASDIATFIETGHGVVALSEPIGTGRYTWLPVSVTPSGVLHLNVVTIVQPGHPVMNGLTNAGLSWWGSSYHNVFTNTGPLTTLALGVEVGNVPLTLAGSYGCGRIVISGQDADFHYVYGISGQQVKFLQNAIDWVVASPPCVEIVDIDIKPGSYPNSINPNAGGVIPVAILTTADFDASTVDPQTVALEDAGARSKGKSGRYGSMEDVDGDGDLDLVVQIENVIEWDLAATEATLTGETYDGIPIQGTDTVNIVPPQ